MIARLPQESLTCCDLEPPTWQGLAEIAADAESLILDLSAVSFLSSSALGKLLGISRKISHHGGSLALCGLDSEIETVFRITRLNRILSIASNPEEAIELLQEVRGS